MTPEQVEAKLGKLRPGSAPGLDKIYPRVLHAMKQELSTPLSIIFNKSLEEGVVPLEWKNTNVTPIFKKGSKTEPGNYRPVSLTSAVCRVMESLLRDAIVSHLTLHNLINKTQHGFVPHRSCLTNLLEYLEKMTDLVDKGHSVDVFYLDFAKAFDKVPHVRLMSKVRAHGITGQVANWIEEWLRNRQQRVVLNGCMSSWKEVFSGVPQGSVLGPILFVLFIDDIDSMVSAADLFFSKFAGDTKAARVVDTDEQAADLQGDLDGLANWATKWQMLFNVDKCKVLHLGRNNIGRDYTMGGRKLLVTEEEKDLGVMIHKSLKSATQVAKAAKNS